MFPIIIQDLLVLQLLLLDGVALVTVSKTKLFSISPIIYSTIDQMDISMELRYVKRKIIPNPVCNRFFGGKIQPSNICIGTTGGHSTCTGDSGGPLVLDNEEKTQIGVTSFGSAVGCQKGFPAVFTRVSHHLEWIAEKTGIF